MHAFDISTLPEQPWKNGGGSTREVVCSPSGAAAFDWRVSIARIAADGPFSRFDGVDRVIVLLAGAGVHLQGEGIAHRLDQPLQPFEFAGDTALHARLIDGACDDFNVMARRQVLRPRVALLGAAAGLAAARRGVVFSARGAWQFEGHGELGSFGIGTGLWWEDEAITLQATPQSADAALLVVAFDEVRA